MTKDLQQIKDEVAKIDNFHNWDALFDSCAMYDYERLESSIDQVAIRYAQEQNRELLDMLELVVMDLEERGRAYGDIYTMSKNLITKHKQS